MGPPTYKTSKLGWLNKIKEQTEKITKRVHQLINKFRAVTWAYLHMDLDLEYFIKQETCLLHWLRQILKWGFLPTSLTWPLPVFLASFWSPPLTQSPFYCLFLFILSHSIWRLRNSRYAFYLPHWQRFDSLLNTVKNINPSVIRPCSNHVLHEAEEGPSPVTLESFSFLWVTWHFPYSHSFSTFYWAPTTCQVQFQALNTSVSETNIPPSKTFHFSQGDGQHTM